MSGYIRANHFVAAANSVTSPQQYLLADSRGLGVSVRDYRTSFSPEEMDQNRATWRIFKESLIGTIGQRKFDWICHRYRSQLHFGALEHSGSPLQPKHVELFSIGSAQVRSLDIEEPAQQRLDQMTRAAIQVMLGIVQPFSLVGHYTDPRQITGAPGTFAAQFIHDKVLMDKEKQMLFSDAQNLSLPAWLERMSKVIVNRELVEGQIIPAPGQDGRIDYYKVYQKIATGDGLVSYALKPAAADSTLRPLVVFRPSQWAYSNEDAIETYLNDVQPHVGDMGWRAAKPYFAQLMRDPEFRPQNRMITVAGYSLGGAHAQYFVSEHHAQINHAIFYNDPSVDDQTAEQFAQTVNALPRRPEPLNIQIYRTKGDFCHYVGGKHLGYGVTHPDINIQLLEIDHALHNASGFYLHSLRNFDNTSFNYEMQCTEDPQELFNHLDNTKRGPEVFWYEKMRRLWGTIAYWSLVVLKDIVKGTANLLGVKILRSSRDGDF